MYTSPRGYTFLNGRLYLPEDWFDREHQARWRDCGIPDQTLFRTEPELALDMVRDLVARDVVPFHWVTCDEHFGQIPGFLDGVAALGKWYFAEVPSNTRVWLHTPTVEPAGPSLLGRPRVRARVRLDAPSAQGLRELAARLPIVGRECPIPCLTGKEFPALQFLVDRTWGCRSDCPVAYGQKTGIICGLVQYHE